MAVWSVLSVIATPFVYVLSDAASLFSDFNSHANAMSLQAKEITGTICSIIKINMQAKEIIGTICSIIKSFLTY